MRLLACGLSAVLLSGCSWLGGGFGANKSSSHHYGGKYASQAYGHGAYNQAASRHAAPRGAFDPCQVPTVRHPVPQGCEPSSVTIGTGGFPQQPNFSAGYGQQTSAGYGSHVADAYAHSAHHTERAPKLRKPKFRGTLSVGSEKSKQGQLLDYDKVNFDPVGLYNPQDYNEGSVSGSPTTGSVTTTTYTANTQPEFLTSIFEPNTYESATRPNISFDDAYSSHSKIALGGEYILNNKTTLFGSAGYANARGEIFEAATIDATLYRNTTTQAFDTDTGAPIGAPVSNTAYVPNQTIARFQYDFSDMERYDLEIGARRYFGPVAGKGYKTVSPFIGVAAGASHHGGVDYTVQQTQTFYERAFDGNTEDATYDVVGPETRVQLYDSQWVPTGKLSAGIDWQVTPKTSLAFETGLRIEGARDYSNGEKGEANVSIPVTLRGSYNF